MQSSRRSRPGRWRDILRTLRDWGYLVSLAALVLALIGFIFKLKGALHTGVVVAIAANIEMLVVGTAYLVTLPFKESLHHGLANLFPPYAFYYWYTRWPKMKTPVKKTVGAFLPIALAGLGYFLYEDGSKIEAVGERGDREDRGEGRGGGEQGRGQGAGARQGARQRAATRRIPGPRPRQRGARHDDRPVCSSSP